MTHAQNPHAHLDEETLHAFVDGALSAPHIGRAGVHIAACAVCAARHDALVRLNEQLRALPELPVERDLRSTILTALAARRARAPAEAVSWRWGVMLVVQICLLLALFAWIAPAGAQLALPAAQDARTEVLATAGALGRFVAAALASLAPLAAWPARATGMSAQLGVVFWIAAFALWVLVNSAAWLGRNHLRAYGATR
jgi:anti-sigma factor RsiW